METQIRTKRKISDHCTYYEATKSYTAQRFGIKNEPTGRHIVNMMLICMYVFEPLRKGLGGFRIGIGAFYRSVALNKKVGGAGAKGGRLSQHCCENGAAMDLDVDGSQHLYNYQLFNYIKDNLEFDQLIWEFGNDLNPDWVHVSYVKEGNRKEILKAIKVPNPKKPGKMKTKYIPYREAA